MGKTITLKGDAAGAFMRAFSGQVSDELDTYRQLATLIHMHVADNRLEQAATVLRDYVNKAIAAELLQTKDSIKVKGVL